MDALREWRARGHGSDTQTSEPEEVDLAVAWDAYEKELEGRP